MPPVLARALPSVRSLLLGVAILVLGLGGYVVARETSIFAVRTIDIRGGTPTLRAQVRKALADEAGRSLIEIDGRSLGRRIAPVPGVRSFGYDRAFPSTLRIVVRPEEPVLVLRRGATAYVVSTSGRVIRPLAHRRRSHLPRLYVPHDVHVRVGGRLPRALATAATTLAPLRSSPLPGGIRSIRAGKDLTLVLAGGLELRLGDHGDLALKIAIARRILAATGAAFAGGGYLDVSVPERPVLSLKSRVEG
ncbi:MAG: cell division protein FtsQ/DivIB [Gaiellaceae bacterium]